ncbi:MAG: citrate transporter [Candidatus Hydrogenedentes bacterium]|nr:citrate transporter [Candidatus Hydrogenedentota bacterium]
MYISKSILAILGIFAIFCIFVAVALGYTSGGEPRVPGVRAEFYIFALTLMGVAIFHHQTLYVSLVGLVSIVLLKFFFVPDFSLITHVQHEWKILVNLLGLLLGFSLLAKHFEDSHIPAHLPKILPDDWKGGFILLALVFVMSGFLDNIAAAIIGGTVAATVFKHKVDIGYIAAIVAASNAGGAGSVLGDTTTTMMWIDGIPAIAVMPAFIAAVPAFLFLAVFASIKQDRYQRIQKDSDVTQIIQWKKIGVVALILIGTITTNIYFDFPALGVWIAIFIGAMFTKTDWNEVRIAFPGSLFLTTLVLTASMMPVNELPEASWVTALILGLISSVFDNIPLTKLALDQGGYDWSMLAYAVGFGGSMIWFGSSAGVALSNIFPQARSVGAWIKHGWFIPIAYFIGFFTMLGLVGWNPDEPHERSSHAASAVVQLEADTPHAAEGISDPPR